MKVLSLFCWQWLTCIFPRKKNISHCYVGLLINHAKDIIASSSFFFFWWKRYYWLRGKKPNHAKNMWRERWSLLYIKCERVRVANSSLIEVVLIRRSPVAKNWYFSSFNFGEKWDRKKNKVALLLCIRKNTARYINYKKNNTDSIFTSSKLLEHDRRKISIIFHQMLMLSLVFIASAISFI